MTPSTRPSAARALLLVFALGLAATTLAACNTMRGVGQDTQAAGRGISGASTDVERKIQ
ncbi:MAG: entericidin A/B family lipoprotein [Rhodospirillales bacterium]|jgi:predicted small secreted protein